jgi:NADP-dependent 3-hydroxy acid dehydrogenase YdfG
MKVLITGASKGIGKGIATHLGRTGFQVGLIARNGEELEQVAEQIRSEGGTAEYAVCDLRNSRQAEEAFPELISKLGGVDALINNAGLVIRKSVFDIGLEEWQAMVDTNLNGLFYATRQVLPALKKQGSGHLINISSISGRVPLPGGSGYAATKYAVTGFTESVYQEVRDFGIKVSVVFPGSVDSESHRHDAAEDTSWKVRPEEVGEACESLLRTAPGTCISLLEIRPLNRAPK